MQVSLKVGRKYVIYEVNIFLKGKSMINEVFLIGKIVSDIEFRFIVHSKNRAIAMFEIETTKDKQKIIIKAYNEMADLVYSKFNKGNLVMISGYMNNSYVIMNGIERMEESTNDN